MNFILKLFVPSHWLTYYTRSITLVMPFFTVTNPLLINFMYGSDFTSEACFPIFNCWWVFVQLCRFTYVLFVTEIAQLSFHNNMTLFVLDWLIDRRHCDLRWHHQLQELKPKIRASLLSLSKNEDTISRILNKEGNTCMVLYRDISMTFSFGLPHFGSH